MLWIDWAIAIFYILALTVSMIVFVRKGVGRMRDFLVAGRSMGFYLGVAALISGETGLISVMGLAQEGYEGGFSKLVLGICFAIGVTFVGLTGFIIVKLREYQIMTIPEFFKMRYGEGFRRFGGLVLGLAGVLNFGVFLYIDSIFFAKITGAVHPEIIKIIMFLILVLALAYTLLAGMVSVLFVNYIQFLVLMLGLLLATIFGIYHAGWHSMVEVTAERFGEAGFNPFAADNLGWPFIISNILVFLTVPCLWQPAAALGLSVRDIRVGKRMYLWSGLTFMGRGTVPILLGVAALAYFARNKHLLPADFKSIEAFPLFLKEVLPPGVKGLLVAGMFAAAMSTYNAYLLAWSAILNQNVVSPTLHLKEKGSLLANRILIILIGCFLLWWGLFYTPPATFFQYQQLTGAIYLSGALATVFFGLYWKRANTVGAYATIIVGAAFPVGSVLFSSHLQKLPEFIAHWLCGWRAGISAFAVALITMVVVSLLSQRWSPPIKLPPVEHESEPATTAPTSLS